MSIRSNKLTRVLALGGITALAAVSLAACSGGGSDSAGGEDCTPAHPDLETVEAGKLTVATYDYPPLMIVDGDTLTGVEGELLKEVAAMECLELSVQAAGGAGAAIPSVEGGRADLAAGDWYRTKARAEVVRLSDPVYLDESAVISLNDYSMDDLEDIKVGSVSGNLWNESLKKWLGDGFVVYQDDESIYGDLEAGRVDAIIASIASSQTTLEGRGIENASLIPLEPHPEVPEAEAPGQAGWPTSYDNEAFGEALDENIAELHESGRIVEVLKEFGVPESSADVGEPYEL
ncbi:substrate-binding periplasmic protein [Leucobacter sp. GX24907]